MIRFAASERDRARTRASAREGAGASSEIEDSPAGEWRKTVSGSTSGPLSKQCTSGGRKFSVIVSGNRARVERSRDSLVGGWRPHARWFGLVCAWLEKAHHCTPPPPIANPLIALRTIPLIALRTRGR